MKFISQYIAPWALSKEDIPIHLMWEPTSSHDRIKINIPAGIVLKEFFNVKDYVRDGSTYIVKGLKTPSNRVRIPIHARVKKLH